MSAGEPSRATPPDEPEEFDLDDDLEEFLAAWDEAHREAAEVLRNALEHLREQPPPSRELALVAPRLRDGLRDGSHPFGWIRKAAGLEAEALPENDAELLVSCAAATISPREETDLDPEEEATLLSLEHADWLGAIVTVVRQGPLSDASPEALADGIRACPEVDVPPDFDFEDLAHAETAFWILALPWHVLGLTDRDQRLTSLGSWTLPRALARAWGSDFDSPPEG